MKFPKARGRDPITGRPTGVTIRPAKLAVDPDGNLADLAGQKSLSLAPGVAVLPPGWRWATEEDVRADDEWSARAPAPPPERPTKPRRETPGAKRGFRIKF